MGLIRLLVKDLLHRRLLDRLEVHLIRLVRLRAALRSITRLHRSRLLIIPLVRRPLPRTSRHPRQKESGI